MFLLRWFTECDFLFAKACDQAFLELKQGPRIFWSKIKGMVYYFKSLQHLMANYGESSRHTFIRTPLYAPHLQFGDNLLGFFF